MNLKRYAFNTLVNKWIEVNNWLKSPFNYYRITQLLTRLFIIFKEFTSYFHAIMYAWVFSKMESTKKYTWRIKENEKVEAS